MQESPSTLANPKLVGEHIQNELSLGHTAGLYATPLFPEFMCSPIGCVPKKNGKWRLILDLCAPVDCSVTNGFAREDNSLRYVNLTPFCPW